MKRLAWAAALAVALAGLLLGPGDALASSTITGVPSSFAYGTASGGSTVIATPFTATFQDNGITTWTPTITASNFTLTTGPSIATTQRLIAVKSMTVTDGQGFTSTACGARPTSLVAGSSASNATSGWAPPSTSRQDICVTPGGTLPGDNFTVTLTNVYLKVRIPANAAGGSYSSTITFSLRKVS